MAAILAASVAPAVVKAGILMPVRSRILLPTDDTAVVQACLDQAIPLTSGTYHISRALQVTQDYSLIDGCRFICDMDGPVILNLPSSDTIFTLTNNIFQWKDVPLDLFHLPPDRRYAVETVIHGDLKSPEGCAASSA